MMEKRKVREDEIIGGEWVHLEGRDPYCFACGQENSSGLRMTFMGNGKSVRSRLVIPEYTRGWQNLVHGGILSTLCDEAMSWAAICLLKRFILTKNMKVTFHKPVIIGREVTVYGYVEELVHERKAVMRADVMDEHGDLCVTGEGEFALFTLEQFSSLGVVPGEQLQEMNKSFSEIDM